MKVEMLKLKASIQATGYDYKEKGFVVCKDSQSRLASPPSLREHHQGYYHKREYLIPKLIENGELKREGNYYKFLKDCYFVSKTLATVIVWGLPDKKWESLKESVVPFPDLAKTPYDQKILSHREPSSITEIEEPSVSVVEKFYDRWKTNSSYSRYISQEKYLEKLFKNDDTNGDIDMIFAKVCALNTCYSTRILAPVEVATRIMELIKSKENGLYKRLTERDPTLVYDIANGSDLNNLGNPRNCYSFATKYCYHQNNKKDFPIYDKFVKMSLNYFQMEYEFYDKPQLKMGNYKSFKKIIGDFQKRFGLEKCTTEQVDKYLWILGKDYLSK